MASLSGRRIVVTRRAGQAAPLVEELQRRGATVLEIPSIEVAPVTDLLPLDEALQELECYTWVVFSSGNAVRAVAERLDALGLPRRLSGRGPRLASAGSATSGALRAAFPLEPPPLEPAQAGGAAALVERLANEGAQAVTGKLVLFPCSDRAREELPRGLRGLGAEVHDVVAYRTIEPPELRARVRRCLDEGVDLVTFASPSAVEAFAAAAGDRIRGLACVAIGETTAEAARAAGLVVRAVARPSTAEGLVEAVQESFGG